MEIFSLIVLTLLGAALALVGCIFTVMFVADYLVLRKIENYFK